jgi:hypothetical protein
MNNHLTHREMLAYVDGELSRAESRHVNKHLHSCWTCLAEMERLKGDIATLLDAQREVFTPALPPPPRPWLGFEAILERNRDLHPSSWWFRFSTAVSTFLSSTRMAVVSFAVLLLVFYGYSIFHVKTVSAKEVLQKIEVADRKRSTITKDHVLRERVHIRKTTRGQASPKPESIDTWKSSAHAYWNIEHKDSAAADLKARSQALKIPADLPLSVASMSLWGMAAGGNPTTSQEGADVNLTFGKVNGEEAEAIERVTLLIEAQSWHVKQMTLDFSDASFEVTEDEYSVIPTSEVPSDLLAYLEPPPATESIEKPVSDAETSLIHRPTVNLDRVALDVFATLHSLKADLGEPVTVTRSRQSIVVGLWQLPPARQNEVHAALSGKPGVQLELTAPRASVRKRTVVSEQVVPANSGTALQIAPQSDDEDQRLAKYFGSSQRQQEFTNAVLETSTTILSHLYALKGLQIQFPAERSLTPEQQAQLHSLVQDHLSSVSTNLDTLANQLAPLERNFGVSSKMPATAPGTTTWQSGSLDLLEKARAVDHLLRALLTTIQVSASPDSELQQIEENLFLLRAETGSFR